MALNGRPLLRGSMVAGGAVTAFRFVDFSGNQAATQGISCRGVSVFAAAAEGAQLTVTEKGSEIVEAGGAISAGADIITDNEGRAIAASALAIAAGATEVTSAAANGATDLTGTTLPATLMGRALNAATGAGQFVEVLLV
jgi:hypothetical protein